MAAPGLSPQPPSCQAELILAPSVCPPEASYGLPPVCSDSSYPALQDCMSQSSCHLTSMFPTSIDFPLTAQPAPQQGVLQCLEPTLTTTLTFFSVTPVLYPYSDQIKILAIWCTLCALGFVARLMKRPQVTLLLVLFPLTPPLHSTSESIPTFTAQLPFTSSTESSMFYHI